MTEPMPMPPPQYTGEPIEKRKKSKGEALFDWGVYGGIAGVGTFLLTVPLTYLLKYGAGAKAYDAIVEGIEKGLSRVLSPANSKKITDEAVMTTTLMMGGNLMLIPVGKAEKHKTQIASGLNIIVGDTTPPEAIEQTPKQTWGSLIEGRGLAWLAVFTTLSGAGALLPRTFTTFKQEFAERVCTLFKRPTHIMKHGRMVESPTYLIGLISALDIFATAAAATLLYVGGHFFARKQEERKLRHPSAAHHGGHAFAESSEMAPSTVEQHTASPVPAASIQGEKTHDGLAQPTSMGAHISA